MKNFILILSLIALFAACGPKRKPIEPSPGPSTPPTSAEPAPPPGEPPVQEPTTPQGPSEKPSVQAPPPQMKPRTAAKGDSASLKLVDSGVKQLNAGNFDDAEQMFEQALRVSPTNGRPYYYLGVVAAKQKSYDRALGFLEQAEIYLHEDDFWMSQVLLEEGLSLKAQGKAQDARAKFQQSVQRDPSNKAAAKELGSKN